MKLLSWFSEKLVRRLVGPSLLLTFLTVCLLGLFAYFSVHTLLRKAVENKLEVAVNLQQSELERWIEDQKTTVVFISRAPFVRERVVDLLSRDKAHPYYEGAYRELSEYLFSYIKNFPGLREIMILSNRGGQVLFSTITENEKEFRGRDSFFLKGREDLYIQGVYPWRESAQPAITIARPLLGALGKKDGVLAVHLNLERMDEIVRRHPGLGQTGEIYLVDQYNTFINATRFGRDDFPRGVHTEGIEKAVSGGEGLGYYRNYVGDAVVGYYRWLPELEVAILAEISEAEAFYPAQQLGMTIVFFGFLVTLLMALGNFLLARRVSGPLVTMSEMAQRVVDGDLSIRMPVDGQDETGAMAESFNRMIQHLQIVYGELESTAEYFKTLFDLSPYAIGVQRQDNGAFVNVNEGFCKMFDLTDKEAVGRSSVDLHIWRTGTSRLRLAALLNKNGRVDEYESDFVRSNGETFKGVISSRLVTLSDIQYVISILLDVSDIKKAEEELQESTERLQLLINRMPIGCITWHLDFTVNLWNPAAENIFGFKAAEAAGKHAFDLVVPPAAQPHVDPIWQHLLEGDETAHSENANVTKDGRTIVCDWYNTPLKDESGQTIGVVSMVRDITDKKAAEEAQRESDERFQLLLEHAADALFLHDGEGIILTVNQRSCDNLGYRRDELIGMQINELEKGVPLAKLQVLWESLVPGKSSLIHGSHLRKDGSSFPVDVNVVKFEFHGAWFYLALARDVTERKATEEELERYRNQLEELVLERTKQLESAQEELVLKERMAVLGQLTATVSHELRNPLGTVKNAIYLLGRLKEAGAWAKADKTLELADRNVRRCDGIINELLDYTRQHEWTPVRIDLGDWITSILDEQEIPAKIKVTRSCKSGISVLCDPERLRRAVVNVFTNAVQALQEVATRKRVLKIRIELANDRVQMVFADNGPGIDDDILGRIFEPMFSTKNFGVGLGMPIVQNIMDEHDGGIDVVSTPGKGTTVTLWLPQT